MTFVKTALFHKAGEGSGGGGGGGDQHNLGWYATESALTTAHATAADGDWAIVGATDTVWVWDSDTTAWKDTGAAGIELPVQTGHSGEFLTTDGTSPSWSDKPLVNTATGTSSLATDTSTATGSTSLALGPSASSAGYNQVVLGPAAAYASASNAVVIGCLANAYNVALNSIAIGPKANVNALNTIQLNASTINATNSDANTFKVGNANGNFEIMSADGTIPTARLTKVNTTVTLTSAGWSGGSQTVSVSGVTSTSVVFVAPDPSDTADYVSAGILCSAQGTNSLTFTATTTPSVDIDVVVVAM